MTKPVYFGWKLKDAIDYKKKLIGKIYKQGKTTSLFQTTRHKVNLIWSYEQ